MRAVVQRVSRASVSVDGKAIGEIGTGLCVLVGVEEGDGSDEAWAMAEKLAGLRIFPDDEDRMNRSPNEVDGSILVVSQFTLLGDLRRGRRPSFTRAAAPSKAEALIGELVSRLRAVGLAVATGSFGARMSLELVNEGPVTLVIETRNGRVSG